MTDTSSNHPLAQSLDLTTERLEQLKKLFPDALSEEQIDFNRLKAALGDSTVQTSERYELSWAGKSEARREIQKRTTATLRPDTANGVNWDTTQNLYIEGENLEVLRTLQKAYFGKVKMIYIDPPYNTGNDSFVYPDDYTERLKEYRARTGLTDEAGFVNKQDMWKKNTKENGQFHSVWLSMMYPRLFLARNLLREDGVIFVSIDDNEAADLKLLMDELFGEENFVAQFIWKSRQNKDNRNLTGVSIDHEYVFCYSKSNSIRVIRGSERKVENYTNPDNDTRGDWTSGNMVGLLPENLRPNCHYDLVNPKSNINYGRPRLGWRYEKATMLRLIEENRILWPSTSEGRPRRKIFIDEIAEKFTGLSSLIGQDIYTRHGTSEIENFFNSRYFDFPKPANLLKELIEQTTSSQDLESREIVLDFFSGSGTTAQAVLELNNEDGKSRQFICIQMPEVLDGNSEAFKAGYRSIADIGRARIKKVIERMEVIRAEASKQSKLIVKDEPGQSLGFNAFKLAPSNFKEWRTDIENEEDLLAQMEYHLDSTKPDSLPQSMVYELLLKLALPITTPIVCHTVKDTQQIYIEIGRAHV